MVNHNSKLLLFDVDGTLTDSAGLTRTALELAAFELYSVENSTRGITAYGQTDRNIFDQMVANNNLPIDAGREFTRFSQVYLKHLKSMLFASDKPRLHLGVRELLERLRQEKDLYLALGTGNVEGGARLKLERHGLNGYFPVGGFGSDNPVRAELLFIGLKKASAHYGIPFRSSDVWVIGDTPNDVHSGQKIGANTIAVATGFFSPVKLASCRPTALFIDFTDNHRFVDVVRNGAAQIDLKIPILTSEQTDEESDPL